MNRLLHDTVRLALVVMLPVLLALAPAMAQTVVYQGETTPLTVVEVPGHTYKWELYSDETVDFAVVPGNCPATSADFAGGNTGAIVHVKWLKAGTYFFKVTAFDAANCTNNLKIGIVVVEASLPTATIEPPAPICIGESSSLNVSFTGTGPWDVTFTDGTTTWTVTAITNNPYLLVVRPKTTTSYWITQVKNLSGINNTPSTSVLLKVNPKPVSSKIYLYQP